MATKVHSSRNRLIAPGVSRFSRSQIYAKRALWKRNKGKVAAKACEPSETFKTVSIKGEKNGGTRNVAISKASKWYPAEDVSKPLQNRKANRSAKLRASIKPGTVLILLAGRFRGKRVVFLKQLKSGLLLVSGPFKVNGVPLRRVNQAYVIATSTHIDVCEVKVPEHLNDEYFKRAKECKKGSTEEEFFGDNKERVALPENKVADQKEVDKQLLKAVSAQPHLRTYLAASFTLTKGQAPHAMKF